MDLRVAICKTIAYTRVPDGIGCKWTFEERYVRLYLILEYLVLQLVSWPANSDV